MNFHQKFDSFLDPLCIEGGFTQKTHF